MPQEITALDTNNAAGVADGGGFFGSLFNGLSKLVTTAAPVAANYYSLKMQGDTLKQQLLSQQTSAAGKPAATTAAATSPTVKPWMIWAGVGGVVLLVLVLMRRKN